MAARRRTFPLLIGPVTMQGSILRRVLSKSPRTVWFRGRQEVRLRIMEATGAWAKLAAGLGAWAERDRALRWRDRASFALVASDAPAALRDAARASLLDSAETLARAERVSRRAFAIFGVPLPRSGSWPWHCDWRTGYEWPLHPYRTYVHGEASPAEVKFPWELSRLSFLATLAHADAIEGTTSRTAQALEILADWDEHNPLANSVNWYPMEAAIRGIELCLFAEMARRNGLDERGAMLLLRVLAAHGEFVQRTIELTDHAGNHWVAELVALLLIGTTLAQIHPKARAWRRFAARHLSREFPKQFLPDGVHFEKSTAYHRLVLDLYLLAATALARGEEGVALQDEARLRAAARYGAVFRRPDGRAPLIGDSDDADLFHFEGREARDHAAGLGIAAVLLSDPVLKAAAGKFPASAAWFFGGAGVRRWLDLPPAAPPEGVFHFEHGGVVVVRRRENYLFMDVGEVGQNGLGGHGHNDLLSFELTIGGRPLVVDPGSYLYSGDFQAHRRFVSSRAHNGLIVDGEEIAPILGNFRISARARPTGARVERRGNAVIITAGHTGFEALDDPVTHVRTLQVDLDRGAVRCEDRVRGGAEHRVTRSLHFEAGLEPVLVGRGEAELALAGLRVAVRWNEGAGAEIVDDSISPWFGHLQPAKTLVLQDRVRGEGSLMFEIDPVDRLSVIRG